MSLFAEEFYHNALSLRILMDSPTVLESMILHDSRRLKGVSLLELLPLMEEVHQMEILSDAGKRILEYDGLAEYWGESYLISEETGLSLIFDEEYYPNLRELSFRGEALDSRSLEIWLSWEGVDELKIEIDRFARHHNLLIRSVEVPGPESKLVSVVRARGDIPDLVMIQSSAVENLMGYRAIQSLDSLRMPELNSSGEEAFTLESRLWGVPFYFDTQLIFYNRGLVSESPGTKWTLEDMERIAGGIGEPDTYPLVWNAYSSNWLIPFQMAFGKDSLLNPDGTITVDDPATRKALGYVLELQEKGLLVPMERDAMDALFIAGKVGMIMAGSYAIPYFESLNLDFGVLPYPRDGESGRPLSPLLDFKAFCVTRRTRSPILARRMLQYLAGNGVQQRFCPALAKLPARTDALGVPGIPYAYLEVLEISVESGTIIPPQHIYSIYKNNMWKLLRFAFSRRMSVGRTLEQGQILMDNSSGLE